MDMCYSGCYSGNCDDSYFTTKKKQFTDSNISAFFQSFKKKHSFLLFKDSPEVWSIPTIFIRFRFVTDPVPNFPQLRHLVKWHQNQNTSWFWKRPFNGVPEFSVFCPFLVPKKWLEVSFTCSFPRRKYKSTRGTHMGPKTPEAKKTSRNNEFEHMLFPLFFWFLGGDPKEIIFKVKQKL